MRSARRAIVLAACNMCWFKFRHLHLDVLLPELGWHHHRQRCQCPWEESSGVLQTTPWCRYQQHWRLCWFDSKQSPHFELDPVSKVFWHSSASPSLCPGVHWKSQSAKCARHCPWSQIQHNVWWRCRHKGWKPFHVVQLRSLKEKSPFGYVSLSKPNYHIPYGDLRTWSVHVVCHCSSHCLKRTPKASICHWSACASLVLHEVVEAQLHSCWFPSSKPQASWGVSLLKLWGCSCSLTVPSPVKATSGRSRVMYKHVPTAILKKVTSLPTKQGELSSIWIVVSAGVVEERSFPNFSSQTLINFPMLLPGSKAKPSSTRKILLFRKEISVPAATDWKTLLKFLLELIPKVVATNVHDVIHMDENGTFWSTCQTWLNTAKFKLHGLIQKLTQVPIPRTCTKSLARKVLEHNPCLSCQLDAKRSMLWHFQESILDVQSCHHLITA